jgi:opacity protein-like surface antigen
MARIRTGPSFADACLLALAGTALISGVASAQPASGFYLSQEIGLNVAPPLDLLGNSNDRASRCDEFINPRFAEVPGCTEPNRGSGAGWKTAYDRAAGLLAGLSAGYRFGERLRVEAEWFHRESEYDQTSPVASATGDTFTKLGGEIQRAEDRIGSISSHNVFANVYVDFPSASRVTPYVGAGVGIGLTELDYGDLWARNPDPAAIATAAGLPNEAEVRRNLAATTTSKQAELHDRLTGYQVLGGADYALSDAVSLGVKVRWVRFGGFTAEDIEWERLRSHESQLRLDGSEPVTFRIRTDGALSFVGVSLAMRYTF